MRINVSKATSDAITACIDSLNLPLAIELLEQGLGTTFQQLLQLKTNLNFLPQEEAEKLKLLSVDLYSGRAEHPQRVAADRNTLIKEIRNHPGLENFLHPNHTQICVKYPNMDLLDLIKGHNVRSRQLLQAHLYGYQEGIEEGLDGFLSWVWTCIVQPIYVALNAHGITSGRLWWCPTGDFTGLPLHAADSADQFIQSYTPTLGALLEANSKTPSTDPPRIGLVGVTHTGP
ncbi:hypothetical protein C8J57DRAFT_1584085 [Mycena rebaudengoi]|nr:hypothetical protein C8J57DRAFT_1584085 [Mycena rebaudengoi]